MDKSPISEDASTISFPETVIAACGLPRQEADTYTLVLASAGISCQLIRTANGWQLHVPPGAETPARAALAAYRAENDEPDTFTETSVWPVSRTRAGIIAAATILAVHLAVTFSGRKNIFFSQFNASATDILNGDIYRITTALFLHADWAHLVGNMVGLALFVTAVCSVAGFGAGSLMVLVSGMLGNLFNALLFQSGHYSIGASTAVFGAVGIVAAHLFMVKWRQFGHRLKTWLPLGSGLALLAILGASINTDVTAHLFGYLSGCAIGLAFSAARKMPPPRKAQYGSLLAAVALVLASFLSANIP